MRTALVALVLLSVSVLNAFAGTTTGTVNQVYLHGSNAGDAILFSMVSDQPRFTACATTARYAISTSTQQGKNILSTILSAKAIKQTIAVVGNMTCVTHGDAEDIKYLIVY